MILRALGADDVADAAGVHALAFAEAWSAADIGALLTAMGGYGFAVRGDDGLAGFILCRLIADEAEVLTLATSPAHRRQGVGAALLSAARTAARAGGAKSMFLEVARDNAAAMSLYAAHGFPQVGMRPGYYRRGADAIDALILRGAP